MPFTPNLTAPINRGPDARSCVVEDARNEMLVAGSDLSSKAKDGEEDQEGFRGHNDLMTETPQTKTAMTGAMPQQLLQL